MKIHFIGEDAGSGMQALEAWDNEGLIPYKTRKCDGFMMKRGNEKYFTDNIDKVTCKLCIRRWNKLNRDQNKQKYSRL